MYEILPQISENMCAKLQIYSLRKQNVAYLLDQSQSLNIQILNSF